MKDAPPSTKNQTNARDPKMHQTKNACQWYFGMPIYVGELIFDRSGPSDRGDADQCSRHQRVAEWNRDAGLLQRKMASRRAWKSDPF